MMRRWLLRAHHLLGSFAALLLLFYAISGLLLNHPEKFGLNHRSWASEALVRHYGLDLPALHFWQAGPHWLSTHENRLLLDGRTTEIACGQLGGTAYWQGRIWANCDGMLLMLNPRGEMQQGFYPGDDLPDEVRLLGRLPDGRPAWDGTGGQRFAWQKGHRWEPSQADLRLSAVREDIDPSLRPALLHSLFGQELSARRVISDLHAGSFFGTANKLMGDAAALALIYLAGSGLYLFFTRRRRRG